MWYLCFSFSAWNFSRITNYIISITTARVSQSLAHETRGCRSGSKLQDYGRRMWWTRLEHRRVLVRECDRNVARSNDRKTTIKWQLGLHTVNLCSCYVRGLRNHTTLTRRAYADYLVSEQRMQLLPSSRTRVPICLSNNHDVFPSRSTMSYSIFWLPSSFTVFAKLVPREWNLATYPYESTHSIHCANWMCSWFSWKLL